MTDIESFLKTSKFKTIGITGNAGAGKTTLAHSLDNSHFFTYSTDYRFIGDGVYRKKLLEAKLTKSLDSYIDACNQYNWWNWDAIYTDLQELKAGRQISMPSCYNRDEGETGIATLYAEGRKIICEGALFGPIVILNQLEHIVFVYVPPKTRLNRLLKKDIDRRSVNEIIARFMITEYSEAIYYRFMFEHCADKITLVDERYNVIGFDPITMLDTQYIPIPV
jgi:uridine kinase